MTAVAFALGMLLGGAFGVLLVGMLASGARADCEAEIWRLRGLLRGRDEEHA